MAPQWSREAIEALIYAYRKEKCLYEIRNTNYYNRYLRAEALKRVANEVCVFRPNTTTKDCFAKMHGLRNQFNCEHAKVKSGKHSGPGLNGVYVPSLWYYKKLLFLAENCMPRKIRPACRGLVSEPSMSTSDDACSQGASETQWFPQHSMEKPFSMDLKILNPISISENSNEPLTTPSQSPAPCTSMVTIPIGPETPPPSLPPAQETTNMCKNRTWPADNVTPVEVVAQNMYATQQQQPPPAVASMVDNFMVFLGSYIKEIKSELIKMQVMSDIHKLVMEAKVKDLQRITN